MLEVVLLSIGITGSLTSLLGLVVALGDRRTRQMTVDGQVKMAEMLREIQKGTAEVRQVTIDGQVKMAEMLREIQKGQESLSQALSADLRHIADLVVREGELTREEIRKTR